MKAEYDKETDTLTITLRDARVKESDEVRPGVIADFGYDGGVVGLTGPSPPLLSAEEEDSAVCYGYFLAFSEQEAYEKAFSAIEEHERSQSSP